MRTFVRLCNLLSTNDELARKVQEHDKQIGVLYQHLQQLLEPPDPPKRNLIGFKEDKTKKTWVANLESQDVCFPIL